MPYEIHWQKRYEFVYAGMKNKPCKHNNRQNSDNTKNAVQTWAKTQQAEF